MNKNKKLLLENGVVIGTASDKYESSNPIARRMVMGFDRAISELAGMNKVSSVLEVGCGEGHVANLVLAAAAPDQMVCTDISDTILAEARQAVKSDRVSFLNCSIYEIEKVCRPAELVVCCEVMEHLDDPQAGLECLAKVANPYCLISVPREPIWRILNLMRGAYVRDFGNTPGHLQHWSRRSLLKMLAGHFEILAVRTPLPWTAVLLKKK